MVAICTTRQARGTIAGLTRGANRNHLIRAAVEAMAYQTDDVLRLFEKESGIVTADLAVDGGACTNDFLMQFQADISDKAVLRPGITESTSLGAAYLAGLQAGVWKNAATLATLHPIEQKFVPGMAENERTHLLGGWQKALRQALAD